MQSPDEMSFDSIWDGLQDNMDGRLEASFTSIYDGGASNQLSVMVRLSNQTPPGDAVDLRGDSTSCACWSNVQHLKSTESGRQKKSQPTGGRCEWLLAAS
jgi:hypothetical protein